MTTPDGAEVRLVGDDAPEGDASLPMTLLQHLDELRKRLVRSSLGIGAAFLLCWWKADALATWCQAPYLQVVGKPLAIMAVAEAFFVKVRLSFLAALFLAAPWIAYQVWAFVSPGLYARERRLAVPFVGLVSIFFIGGGAFGYYVGLPAMLRFLLGQAATGFEVVVRAESYVSTFVRMIVGMGLVFEAPVLAALLTRMRLLTPGWLVARMKHAIVIITILAAFITPSGDIPTMLVFAVPMLGLYFLSIAISWACARKAVE